MTAPLMGVRAPRPRACRLCKSTVPSPDCPQCELRQPGLFSLPLPQPSEEDLAAGDADREAALTAGLARAHRADVLQHYGALGRQVRVGLVGCSKTKRAHQCAARHFYASDLFRSALAYAERATDEVYILSAFHGLVGPDELVAPYDHPIAELTKQQRLAWGDRVIGKLAARLPKLRLQLVILSGRDYAIPVEIHALRRGWTIVNPLSGLMVGERLSWLKREAEASAPTPRKRQYRRRSVP